MLYQMFLKLSAEYTNKANAEVDGPTRDFYLDIAKGYTEAASKLPKSEHSNQYTLTR